MKVIAIKPGFHGKLREVGDEFDVKDGSKATWYVPANSKDARNVPQDHPAGGEGPKVQGKTRGNEQDAKAKADAEAKAKKGGPTKGENHDDLV
jgi:hypothetical protein